jgi:transcriptional regulator with XRE-family HTH domain
MLTDFGTFLKTLMLKKGNITQDALAKKLGCSPSHLSVILNGQMSPGIEFFEKCRDYFDLNNEETITLLRTGLSSSKTITLDMSYFPPKNKTWFIDILTALLLYPKMDYVTTEEIVFDKALATIKDILASQSALNPMRKADEKKTP